MTDDLSDQRDISGFYEGVTSPLVGVLRDFRGRYAPQMMAVEGSDWHYYEVGAKDAPALLLLPGGGGDAETNFRYMLGFGEAYRVIAPNIPTAMKTVEQAITDLRALVGMQTTSNVIVVGIGWGAQLAQLYIRRYPDDIDGAILAHATLPNERDGERVRMQRNFMRVYPPFVLRTMLSRAMRRAIGDVPMAVAAGDRAFWQAYYGEMFAQRWGRREILSRARLSLDFHEHYTFDARDVLRIVENILIIESEADEVVGEGERGSLKTMYPSAYVQTLEGSTHLAPVVCADAYLRSMLNFLQRDASHEADT